MDPEYLMDKAPFWELSMLFDALSARNEEHWKQARFIGYVTAQVNSSKPISISELLPLPSDKKVVTKSRARELRDAARKVLDNG